ncbi:hypothetical protein NIES4071_31100 [Calothrix sp. NIES-4071]|nr:hypothetical protein NIES4071_31100 [Calothrix sp. NIES-4071]BAZ57430.1 hypothetical protein NIES4105_31040 [Calothrix sp. NIES-4105]
MMLLKNKKLILGICLLCSMGYFGAVSNAEVNSFLRGELILIPLQALALIYVTFFRTGRKPIPQEWSFHKNFKI